MKIRVRLRADGPIRSLVLWLLPSSGFPAASLRAQIAGLEWQRRSGSSFRGWRPGVFYYLFAPVAAFWICWLASPARISLRGMATVGFTFGLLCLVPNAANRLGIEFLFHWPNRVLDRRIALLRDRLKRSLGAEPMAPLALPAPAEAPVHADPIPVPTPVSLPSSRIVGAGR